MLRWVSVSPRAIRSSVRTANGLNDAIGDIRTPNTPNWAGILRNYMHWGGVHGPRSIYHTRSVWAMKLTVIKRAKSLQVSFGAFFGALWGSLQAWSHFAPTSRTSEVMRTLLNWPILQWNNPPKKMQPRDSWVVIGTSGPPIFRCSAVHFLRIPAAFSVYSSCSSIPSTQFRPNSESACTQDPKMVIKAGAKTAPPKPLHIA